MRPIKSTMTADDWAKLRKCERTLQKWAELGCNHDLQQQESGKYTIRYNLSNGQMTAEQPIANRHDPALKRAEIIAARYGLAVYEQTDPRGCSLYLYDPADSDGIDNSYSMVGLAVC